MKSSSEECEPGVKLVTNHARVLCCIARDPSVRLREISEQVGLTERAVVQIVNDLEKAGYLTKTREGRRNRYDVHGELNLALPRRGSVTVALAVLLQALEQQPLA